MKTSVWVNNSYACFMPIHTLYQIVSIKIGYTVGRNKEAIKKYIANQLQEDKLYEQLSMKEYIDPFTGEPVKGSK